VRRKSNKSDVIWVTIMIAIIAALVVFAVRSTRNEQADCEDRGGTIVRVHNSQTGEWFCQEPR